MASLGPGLLESAYSNCLETGLRRQRLKLEKQLNEGRH
ncbi:MAG: GxxExxY protein [Gemmatimonadota bacterium]